MAQYREIGVRPKVILFKSYGEFFLLMKFKTSTFWPTQSYSFKKVKVSEIKLTICTYNVFLASFISLG